MNYQAAARSNYFRVVDAEAFRRDMSALPDVMVQEADGRFTVLSTTGTGWPSGPDEAADSAAALPDILRRHLTPDSVAVLMEAGYEGERYVTGQTVAIAPAQLGGGSLQLNLEDIYQLAERAFPGAEITRAEY